MSTQATAETHTIEHHALRLDRTPPQAIIRCSCGWEHREDALTEDGSMNPATQRAEDAHSEHANPEKAWTPGEIREAAETVRAGAIVRTTRPSDPMPKLIADLLNAQAAGPQTIADLLFAASPETLEQCKRIMAAIDGVPWPIVVEHDRALDRAVIGAPDNLDLPDELEPMDGYGAALLDSATTALDQAEHELAAAAESMRAGRARISAAIENGWLAPVAGEWVSYPTDQHAALVAGLEAALEITGRLSGADADELAEIHVAHSELSSVLAGMRGAAR